jgi:hypothetical protein
VFLVEGALPVHGSAASWSNDRFSARIHGPVASLRISGRGQALFSLFKNDVPLRLVCQMEEDQKSPSKLRLTVLDASPLRSESTPDAEYRRGTAIQVSCAAPIGFGADQVGPTPERRFGDPE